MKIKLLLMVLIAAATLNAQWTKVSNQSGGIAGKIHVYNSVVFLYGPVNNFSVYRSDNAGQTWSANIANKFSYDVYNMFNYKNEIFAVTTTLGQNIWRFYTSKDEGLTWSEKSTIQNVTGNGAILSMTSDGNKLYAVSNRKSFYTSLDNGITWKETIMNTTVSGNIIYFAASSDNMVAVIAGVGAVVSTDGGQSWAVNNPTNPASVINYVINFNGSIYGATQSGVAKFNASTKAWDNLSKGLPDPSSFHFSKILSQFGNTLYFATVGFLDSKPLFFYSNDGGANWNSLTNSGLTTISSSTTSMNFGVNSQNILLYDFNNTTKEASLYRLTNNTTNIKDGAELPNSFELKQNYPNPFNPETTISYSITTPSNVSLKVYDVLGNEVAALVNQYQQAGSYNSKFSLGNYQLTSGVYFYTLRSEGFSSTQKMILIK